MIRRTRDHGKKRTKFAVRPVNITTVAKIIEKPSVFAKKTDDLTMSSDFEEEEEEENVEAVDEDNIPKVTLASPTATWINNVLASKVSKPSRRQTDPTTRASRIFTFNLKLNPCSDFHKMTLDDIAEPEDPTEKSSVLCFISLLYAIKTYIDERRENKNIVKLNMRKKTRSNIFSPSISKGKKTTKKRQRNQRDEEEDDDSDDLSSVLDRIVEEKSHFTDQDQELLVRDIHDICNEIGPESFSNENNESIKIAEVKIEPIRSRGEFHQLHVVRLLIYVHDKMFNLARYITKWIHSNYVNRAKEPKYKRGRVIPAQESWLKKMISNIKVEPEYVRHLANANLVSSDEMDAYMSSHGTYLLRPDCPINIEKVFSIRKETIERGILDLDDVEPELVKLDMKYQPLFGDVINVSLGSIVNDPLRCFKMPLYGMSARLYEKVSKEIIGFDSMKAVEGEIVAEEAAIEREIPELEKENFIYKLKNENRRTIQVLKEQTQAKLDSVKNSENKTNAILTAEEESLRELEIRMLDIFVEAAWNTKTHCTDTFKDMMKYFKNPDQEKVLPDFESDVDLSPFGRLITGFRDRYQICFDMRKDETITHFLLLWFAAINCYSDNRELGLNILTTGGPQTSKSENFKNLEKCSIGTVRWVDHLTMGAFTAKGAIHDENFYVQDEADLLLIGGGDGKANIQQGQVMDLIKTMISKRFCVTMRQNIETMEKIIFQVSCMCNFGLCTNRIRGIMKEDASAQRSRMLTIHKTSSQSKYSSDYYKQENNIMELIGSSIMRDSRHNRPFPIACHFLQFCTYMYNMLIKIGLVPDVPAYTAPVIVSAVNKKMKEEGMENISARDFERIVLLCRESAITTAVFTIFCSTYKWFMVDGEMEFNPCTDKLVFKSTKEDFRDILLLLLNNVRKLVYVTEEMVVFALGVIYPSVCNDDINVTKMGIIDEILSYIREDKSNSSVPSRDDIIVIEDEGEINEPLLPDECDENPIHCRVFYSADAQSSEAINPVFVLSQVCQLDLNYKSIRLPFVKLSGFIRKAAVELGCLEPMVYEAIQSLQSEMVLVNRPFESIQIPSPASANKVTGKSLKEGTIKAFSGRGSYDIIRKEKAEQLPAVRIESVTKGGVLYFNILRDRIRNFNPKTTSTNARIKEIVCKILSSFHTPKEGKKLLCSFPVEGDPYVLDIINLYHDPTNHISYTFPKNHYDVGHSTFSLMRPEEIVKYTTSESFLIIDRNLDEWCHRKTMELYSFHRAGISNYNYDDLKPFFEKYRTIIKKTQLKLCSGEEITPEEMSSIHTDDSIIISPPEVYPDHILKRRRDSALYYESQKHKSSLDIIVDHLILNGEVAEEDDEELSENEKGKEIVKRLSDISSLDEKLYIIEEAASHRKAEEDSKFNSINELHENNKQNMKTRLIPSGPDKHAGTKRRLESIAEKRDKCEKAQKYVRLLLEKNERKAATVIDPPHHSKNIESKIGSEKIYKETGYIETEDDIVIVDKYL